MLGPRGNPKASNLFAILAHLKQGGFSIDHHPPTRPHTQERPPTQKTTPKQPETGPRPKQRKMDETTHTHSPRIRYSAGHRRNETAQTSIPKPWTE